MTDERPDPIRLRDDILQFLYWMEGEGLGRDLTLEQLSHYLKQPGDWVGEAVAALQQTGHLEREASQPPRFRLSDQGSIEGRRRFQEEFEPYLGQESHLVCDDPDCDCHSPDFQGACRHLSTPQD